MPLSEVHTVFDFRFNQGKLAAIERGTKRSATHLSTTAKNVDLFRSRVSAGAKRIGQAFAAYGAYRGLRLLTSDYAAAADATAKFSSGLGINAQQYQRMTHAAQLNGVSIAELNVALPNLAKRAGDAADGSKEAALAFRRAGVELREGGKLKDPIRLLTDLADGMKNMKDEGRRTQVLMNLFGRSGKKMGVLMSQGSEGIKKAMAEADKLGIVLSKKALKDAENFNDEMLRVKGILTGIRNTIASKLLPTINKALRSFQLWWREGNNAERAMRAMKITAIFTAIAVGAIVTQGVLRRLGMFVKGLWAGVKAMRALNLASAAAAVKVMLVLAGFALVYLIIEDLVYFAQGKDSLIGRLLGDTQLAKELKNALIGIAKAAKQAWSEIAPALKQSWNELKPALAELGAAIKPLIGPAFRAGVKAMIVSFQGLAWMIRITSDLIQFQIKSWKGFTSAASSVKNALAPIVSFLWKIIKATRIAKSGLDALTGAKNTDLGKRISQVTGQKTGGSLAAGFSAVVPGTGTPGVPMPHHIMPPIAGGTFSRPLAASQSTVHTNVAAGAFPITVHASGDPAQIARAVNSSVKKNVKRVITRASRDLKKPAAGQQ